MKNVFSAIGRFFKKNYWIEPLLLVVIVFAIVFSLEGVSGIWDTISAIFSSDSKPKELKMVNIEKCEEVIETSEERVYVYYYTNINSKVDEDNDVEDVNEIVNNYVERYNKDHKDDKLNIYAVNYGVKKLNKYHSDVVKKYYDKKMNAESREKVADDINAWALENDKDYVTKTDAALTYESSVVKYPTIVCYYNGEVEAAYRGSSEITKESLKELFTNSYLYK